MPQTWTRDRVCAVLVDLFRARPGLHVRGGWRIPPSATIGAADVELNWDVRFFPDDADDWDCLRVWARGKAAGDSVASQLRGGRSRRAFDRAWKRAADTVAAGLNAELNGEGVNRAVRLADDAAAHRIAALQCAA